MGAGPKKKEEPKVEVVAPVVKKAGPRSPEKPKLTKKKVEPPKIILSPLEVTDVHSCRGFSDISTHFVLPGVIQFLLLSFS